MTSELVADPGPTFASNNVLERLTALRQTLAPTLTDPELALFALVAERKGLDPFSGQIMAVKRNSRNGARVTYQTGIDGYRSIAERTGNYLGSDEAEYGEPCDCGKLPNPHPVSATVYVRRWFEKPQKAILQPGTAFWHEFVPSEDFVWREKPRLMLAKCAEAQALRKAFPWVLGDLYIPEEMARADDATASVVTPVATAREAVAQRAASIRVKEATGVESGVDTSATIYLDAVAQKDDEPPTAPVVAEPLPGAGGPGAMTAIDPNGNATTTVSAMDAHALTAMTATEFNSAVIRAGITKGRIKLEAERMFPGRKADELSGPEWSALYAELVRDPLPTRA